MAGCFSIVSFVVGGSWLPFWLVMLILGGLRVCVCCFTYDLLIMFGMLFWTGGCSGCGCRLLDCWVVLTVRF